MVRGVRVDPREEPWLVRVSPRLVVLRPVRVAPRAVDGSVRVAPLEGERSVRVVLRLDELSVRVVVRPVRAVLLPREASRAPRSTALERPSEAPRAVRTRDESEDARCAKTGFERPIRMPPEKSSVANPSRGRIDRRMTCT